MPNRFDRRLKGSGLIPGSSSCKTKTTNIPMNKNIQKSSSNTKVTNTVSNTKVKQSNILKTGVNTMVILDNHKNSINKLNDMLKKVANELKETEKKYETNYNFTYGKINDIETFLEKITIDNSLNVIDDNSINVIDDNLNNNSDNISLTISEIPTTFKSNDISDKTNKFNQDMLNNKINKLIAEMDILKSENVNKITMDDVTKQTRINTLFIKKLFEDKVENDLYKKMRGMNKTLSDIKFKMKKIMETQEMLKKMCIDNDTYIKKYKLRKEKTINEQKQKMNSIIPEIPEYDKKYNLRGVPERLLGGLNSVQSMRDIIPEYTKIKKKKAKQKKQNKTNEVDEQMIKEQKLELKIEASVKQQIENA
mgnify:CR=1 FL=1|tara:strand:+ start:1481 stop:2575 length:1095 start_codon:yes stop_codon:yes gene_type:complete